MHSDKFKYSMAPIAKEDWDRVFGGFIQHSSVASVKESAPDGRTPLPDVPRARKSNGCKCGRSYYPA
jgi:hypothetical protein